MTLPVEAVVITIVPIDEATVHAVVMGGPVGVVGVIAIPDVRLGRLSMPLNRGWQTVDYRRRLV